MERPRKRQYVWLQLQRLAGVGLGTPVRHSDRRDNFLLRLDHPAARRLTTHPGVSGAVRFVRADPGGLLFRAAAPPFLRELPEGVRERAMNSRKGLEFRWGQLNDQALRALFDALLRLAGPDPELVTPPGETMAVSPPVRPGAGSPPDRCAQLEARLAPLLEPVQGQWLRPWMTTLLDPAAAKVFIVGRNQSKTYPEARLSRERYLDSLFNRNGESCRALYDELTEGRASPTRHNIDVLSNELSFAGVLETNVVCFSTRGSEEFREAAATEGYQQGLKIFPILLDEIRPRVLVLFGAGAVDLAQRHLRGLPSLVEPLSAEEIQRVEARVDPFGDRFRVEIIVIPSLAPPKFNRWNRWWPHARRRVVTLVREVLASRAESENHGCGGRT